MAWFLLPKVAWPFNIKDGTFNLAQLLADGYTPIAESQVQAAVDAYNAQQPYVPPVDPFPVYLTDQEWADRIKEPGSIVGAAGRAASVSAVQDAITAGTIVVNGGSSAPRAAGLLAAATSRRTLGQVRIVGAGSSTMAGTGATNDAGRWFNQFIAALQAAFPSGRGSEVATVASDSATFTATTDTGIAGYNAGDGGTNSTNYLTSAEITRVAALNPAVVIHMVGSNDYADGRAPATVQTALSNTIASIDSQATLPVLHVLVHAHQRLLSGTPAYSWSAYGDAMRAVAAAAPDRRICLDVSLAFAAAGVPTPDALDLLGSDNIHLTPAGHTMMATLVRQMLDVPAATSVAAADTTAPTVPGGLTATVGNAQVSLAWTASTDNVAVTKYRVRRGGTVIAEPTTNSYVDTGLTNGTQYSYTVSALDAAGNESAQTSAVTATPTAVADTTPPTVPTNLTAGTPTSSSVPLSWTASTDAVGVTGYRIYNGTTLLTSVTGTSTTLTGLASGTTYSLSVSAVDGAGNESAKSTAVSVTTAAGPAYFLADDMTGADGASITTRAGQTGGWADHPDTVGTFVTSGTGTAYRSGNTSTGRVYGTPAPPTADYEVRARIVCKTRIGGTMNIGARYTTSGARNGYYLRYTESTGVWDIVASTGSGPTQTVIAAGITVSLAAGDTADVVLTVKGSTISATVNGQLVGSATSTSITAVGSVALFSSQTNVTATTGLHVDSLYALAA